MIDHAQAKIRMMDAAVRVAEQVESKLGMPLGNAEVACLNQLKRAVLDFKETKQPKRVDGNGDDFDSFHGCG
jgi:hypothetical protein